MADIENTQYYDLEPVEEPKRPSFFKRKPVRVAFIALGILVLVGAVIGLVVFFLSRNAQPEETSQSMLDGMARELADCAQSQDPEACEARVRTDAARALGEVSVCAEVAQDRYVNCVELVAIESGKVEVCDAIENEEAVRACQDAARLNLAIETEDISQCEEIQQESRRTSCLDQLNPPEDPFAALVESGDLAGCQNLEPDMVEPCEIVFRSIDRDDDGLNDFDEIREYGTDPNNPDTDGDGFEDGEEVANGFDPLR